MSGQEREDEQCAPVAISVSGWGCLTVVLMVCVTLVLCSQTFWSGLLAVVEAIR